MSATLEKMILGVGPKGGGMIVGMAPHTKEMEEGLPFVGRSGKKLWSTIPLDREDVYVTNVVKFFPRNAPKVEVDEFEMSLPDLLDEIEEVNPTHILTLGGLAFKALTNSTLLGPYCGIWQKFNGEPIVMPTWHPSFILRSTTPKVFKELWPKHLAMFAEAL